MSTPTPVEVTEIWYRNEPGMTPDDAPHVQCKHCLTYVGPLPGWPTCTANPKVTIRYSDDTEINYCMSCYAALFMDPSKP